MRKLRKDKPTVYSPSMTKPGQALIPAKLLERHLAGTLPDIQKQPMFTHDENGQQISEDLSHLELHELFDLTNAMKAEIAKRKKQLDEENEENYKKKIIEEYSKSSSSKQLHPEGAVGTAAVSAKGDGAAGDRDTGKQLTNQTTGGKQ